MNSMWFLTLKNEGACKCIRGGERERLLLVRRVGNGEGSVMEVTLELTLRGVL